MTLKICARRHSNSIVAGERPTEEQLERQAPLLFLLLEDCLALLPAWMHELHNDATTSNDVAEVVHACLAGTAHIFWASNTLRKALNLKAQENPYAVHFTIATSQLLFVESSSYASSRRKEFPMPSTLQ
jgi:hypothetical protein